jgi:hypothetical protein
MKKIHQILRRFVGFECFSYLVPAIFLVLMFGCMTGAPYTPETWVGKHIDLRDLDLRPEKTRLQVIVCYGYFVSNHTALRLIVPGRQVLFWDPGGGYGADQIGDNDEEDSTRIIKQRDIVTKNPPDIPTYLEFRWKVAKDAAVEIFEWDLNPEEGARLYDVLWNGTGPDHPAGAFRSKSWGLMCGASVSDFLKRFAKPRINLTKKYHSPRDLAEALYTQSPDRIFSQKVGHSPKIFILKEK